MGYQVTRPDADQVKITSAKTGEWILEDYIQNAEKGTKTIGQLLDDLFNPDGTLRTLATPAQVIDAVNAAAAALASAAAAAASAASIALPIPISSGGTGALTKQGAIDSLGVLTKENATGNLNIQAKGVGGIPAENIVRTVNGLSPDALGNVQVDQRMVERRSNAEHPIAFFSANMFETDPRLCPEKFSFNPGTGVMTVGGITSRGSIGVTGNVLASGNITAYSDIRLKTNLQKIDSALFKVGQLNGYTYNMRFNGAKQVGLVAQEVEKVMPEAVDKTSEYWSLAYGNLVALLVESTKELVGIIHGLETRISVLEAKV